MSLYDVVAQLEERRQTVKLQLYRRCRLLFRMVDRLICFDELMSYFQVHLGFRHMSGAFLCLGALPNVLPVGESVSDCLAVCLDVRRLLVSSIAAVCTE